LEALKPKYRVVYEGTDISADISNYLIQLSYTDAATGEADEVSITLDNSTGIWTREWKPRKGEKFSLEFGYDSLTPAGDFTVDEIEVSGMPDQLEIKGLSASISKSLRSKQSRAFEQTTLIEIAEKIAQKNGLQLEGVIEDDIEIDRVTQNRETDLGFLNRVANEYAYLFSVRGNKLVFTTEYERDLTSSVTEIDKTDISSYSIQDKTYKTFKEVSVIYRNTKTNKTIRFEDTALGALAKGIPLNKIATALGSLGGPVSAIVANQAVKDVELSGGENADDKLELKIRAENDAQAKRKAAAAIYRTNTRKQSGSISLQGNPVLISGSNFILTGLGYLSGTYQIEKSEHTISNAGYITSLEIKKVGAPTDAQQQPKKVFT